MRNRILYYVLIGAALCMSCNDWLDVKPKTQLDVNEMFKAEEGFKDALTSCYMKLKSRDLYGENMTMSAVEYLAQHWSLNSANYREEEKMKDFDFDTDYARGTITTIYQGLYNVIAQANIVLENLDESGDIIKNEEVRGIIRAEALAIRAFCHLDVLRLFGQMPQHSTIPINLTYAKEVTHGNLPLYGYQDFAELILQDLNDAEELLKRYDPLLKYTYAELSSMGNEVELSDSFLGYRRFRFNYYAVQALKARLYMYMGNKSAAYQVAKALIETKTEDGLSVISLSGSNDLNKEYFALPSECLLVLNNHQLPDYIEGLMNTNKLRESTARLKELFAGQPIGENNRYLKWWNMTDKDSQGVVRSVLLKYKQSKEGESIADYLEMTMKQIIPLIRLSEVYLIGMESTPSLDEANAWYQEYMRARNVLVSDLTREVLNEEIVKEYRREFYGEGQMFFTYKRLGIKQMMWKSNREVTEKDYIVPKPASELNNN